MLTSDEDSTDERLRAHFLLEEALTILDRLGEQLAAIDVDHAINLLGLRPVDGSDGHRIN